MSDDGELIQILRGVVFSGNGVCRFVIYNFAMHSEGLVKRFEEEICSVMRCYYLCRQVPEVPDRASLFLYGIGKLRVVRTAGICEKSIAAQVKEIDEALKAWCVLVIGPSQSGKTGISKYLVEEKGFVALDYSTVFDETKAFHSTEEDQRETVTFSELLQGIDRFFEKNSGKTIVIDGFPPNEILYGADPKYPAYPPIPSEEEGYLLEEDPQTHSKLLLAAQRLSDFLSRLRILFRIQLEAPWEVLESRIRSKLEISAEDPISAEGKRELLESWRISEKLSESDYLLPHTIPHCLTFNTSTQAVSAIFASLNISFQRKIVLVRGDRIVDAVISLFCWKNQLFYLDLGKVLQSAAGRLDALGEAVRKGNVDHSVKIALLKQALQGKGLRDRVVVIGGYENDPELEYESGFEELVLFEKELGEIQMLINVQSIGEDVEIEQIPVRQRKDLSKTVEVEEGKVGNEEEENSEEEGGQKKLEEVVEEVGEPPMWNHYLRSGFSKNYHNFKGKRAELVEISMIRQGSVNQLLECMQKGLLDGGRYNIQVVADLVVEEVMQSELGMMEFPSYSILRQELPLDIRDLGNVSEKVAKILTNPNAANFYQQIFIGLSCSFSVFWENFQHHILAEGWKVTPEIRSTVKELVDPNKNGYVSVSELNSFFNIWDNPEKRSGISIKSQSKIPKTSKFPSNSLILLVQSSTPDPATNAKTFTRGEHLEITANGCQNSKRGQDDGYVYFGKSNKRARNDIEFSSADTRISFLHFLIRIKRKGYFLIDNGGKNGAKVRATDSPILLLRDFICKINQHCFRISHIQAPSARIDDSITKLTYKDSPHTPEGEGEISLEFISEELKGQTAEFTRETKRITIGSNKDCDIVLPGSDNLHAVIEMRSLGWCLIDQHSSTGCFIYISTWDRYSTGSPSRQLLLSDSLHISVPGTEFEVVLRPAPSPVLSVSPNPALRECSFRKLYRMGRYIKPGTCLQEFECTHQFRNAKCLVQVAATPLCSPEILARLSKLKSINHEALQQVLEIISDGPHLYIVSELLQGGDLQEALALRTSMSEAQAAHVFKNLVVCLDLLHSHEITHGNVRPEHFAQASPASDTGIMKVSGLVRGIFAQDSQLLEYMAPECLQGKATAASDVWAAGVILYLLLTGVHPFRGTSPEETKAYIRRAAPSFKPHLWEGVTPYAKILLKSIFVKDPRKRPSCAEILRNNWINGKVKFVDLDLPLSSRAIKELKSHACSSKLNQAVNLFISRVVASEQEKEQALVACRQLDAGVTGKLARNEILSVFEYLHCELSEGEMEGVVREVDAGGTGRVDYLEVLDVVSSRRKGFNAEKLEAVFSRFESDGGGVITTAEVRKSAGEGKWDEVVKIVEAREDGKIDIKEFKNILMGMLPSL